MKRSLLIHALVLFCLTSYADNIRWLSTDYDFGTFKEEAGKQSGVVRFINQGKEPTVINRVKVSCGCTATSYTDGEIAPGDTASVEITYDPDRRPGRFEKTVKVYTGLDNRITTIRIHGTVIGKPSSVKEFYPVEAGPLMLATDRIAGGKVKEGSASNIMISAYNRSTDSVSVSGASSSAALDVSSSVKKVAPGDIVTFSFYFNTRKNDSPGIKEIPVKLRMESGGRISEYELLYSINVEPQAMTLSSEELLSAPRLSAETRIIDLGKVSRKRRKISFRIQNVGKSPLEVRRIASNNEALKVLKYPARLAAGKKGVVELEFNPAEFPEAKAYGIDLDIITNDPSAQRSKVRLAAEIVP